MRVLLGSMSTPESTTDASDASGSVRLRIVFATGTNPGKWFRRFTQRIPARLITESLDDPMRALGEGAADMAILRLESAVDASTALPDAFRRIRLYDEAWGVAFEKEHVFSLSESIALGLLADETVLLISTDPGQLRQMLPVAATGAGVVVGPRTILKALSKKAILTANLVDVESQEQAEGARPMSKTSVWLVWPKESDDELRQEFVGIVQGRREGSTRTQMGKAAEGSKLKKLSAREKTLAKQARRAGGVGKRDGGQGGARKPGRAGKTGRAGRKPGRRK